MGDLATAFHALRAAVITGGHEFGAPQFSAADAERAAQLWRLPKDLVIAYATAGPAPGSSIPWVVEEMFIFSIAELPDAQNGYRWSGPERHRLHSWRSEWVVVASLFGDPFFVDTRDNSLSVHFARHGAGEWNPRRISTTMPSFIDALAVFESVLLGEFGTDVWDASGLRPDFIDRLTDALAEVLDSTELTNFVWMLRG